MGLRAKNPMGHFRTFNDNIIDEDDARSDLPLQRSMRPQQSRNVVSSAREDDDLSEEDDAPLIFPQGPSEREARPRRVVSSGREAGEARESGKRNEAASKGKELVIIGCGHYKPNRKFNFHEAVTMVHNFDVRSDSLRAAGLAVLNEWKMNPYHYSVELHGAECDETFGDTLPAAYRDRLSDIFAHLIPRQSQIVDESASDVDDLDVDTAANALLIVVDDAPEDTVEQSNGEVALRKTDITNFVYTTTNEYNEEIHYIRVGQMAYKTESANAIEFLGIVLAHVNAATEEVKFVLTDAWVLSGVQYGHCDLGVNIDIKTLEWMPDPWCSKIRAVELRPDHDDLLVGIAQGEAWVRDDGKDELFKMNTLGSVKPDAEKLESTIELCKLPFKPEYKRDSRPAVVGDLKSSKDIDCVVYWRNETRTDINLNDLINKQVTLEPHEDYNAVEHWVIQGDESATNEEGFEGLSQFLSSRRYKLGEYRKDWNVEIFVLAQIPESTIMWSWTSCVRDWKTGQWLSGRANEAFDRSLYMEVHIKLIVKEEAAMASTVESEEKPEEEPEEEHRPRRGRRRKRNSTDDNQRSSRSTRRKLGN